MMLHHTSTICLIYFSHILNVSHIGAVVLWLHEWADVPIAYSRTCIDYKSQVPGIVGMIGIISVWIYSRLWAFPNLLYYGLY